MFPSYLRSHGRPHLLRDPGCDLVILIDFFALHKVRRAAWSEKTRHNKCILFDLVTASYKIKARKASPTTRWKLSTQQLYTRYGWTWERQLGTMVDTQLLFALLRWRSCPSNQTMSRHRVRYYTLWAFFTSSFICYHSIRVKTSYIRLRSNV